MYESFYRLSGSPFSLAPDPSFFFESTVHKRGLDYLRFGLHQGQGFVIVTGMPGTGKSMLVKTLLAEIPSRKIVVTSITNTNLEADDVLQVIASHFGVYKENDSKASILTKLEKFFIDHHNHGRRVLLLVDEAHNLPSKSLEELRMLSNFQQGNQPLLQIMLLGQQQLQHIMLDPGMEQLTQRVIASCHLDPVSAQETRDYIQHRLRQVGWAGNPSISSQALGLIYRVSQGIPRLINMFCDRLLLAASLDEKHEIDAAYVESVIVELQKEGMGNWVNHGSVAAESVVLCPLPDENSFQSTDARDVDKQVVEKAGSESAEGLPDNVTEFSRFGSLVSGDDGASNACVVSSRPSAAAWSTGATALNKKSKHEVFEELLSDSGAEPFAKIWYETQPETSVVSAENETRIDAMAESDSRTAAAGNEEQKKIKGVAIFIAASVLVSVIGTAYIVSSKDEVAAIVTADQTALIIKSVESENINQPVMSIIEAEVESPALQLADQVNGGVGEVGPEQWVMSNSIATLEESSLTESKAVDEELVEPVAKSPDEINAQNQSAASVVAQKKTEVSVAPVNLALAAKLEPVKSVAAVDKKVPENIKSVPKAQPLAQGAIVRETKSVDAKVITPAPVSAEVSSTTESIRVPPLDFNAVNDVVAARSLAQDESKNISKTPLPEEADDPELSELLANFVRYYEEGDLQNFLSLFASDAVVGESLGLKEIKRDYKELFKYSDMRAMQLNEMRWQNDDGVTSGHSNFNVLVWRHRKDPPVEQSGTIEIEVMKMNGQFLIRKLAYSLGS